MSHNPQSFTLIPTLDRTQERGLSRSLNMNHSFHTLSPPEQLSVQWMPPDSQPNHWFFMQRCYDVRSIISVCWMTSWRDSESWQLSNSARNKLCCASFLWMALMISIGSKETKKINKSVSPLSVSYHWPRNSWGDSRPFKCLGTLYLVREFWSFCDITRETVDFIYEVTIFWKQNVTSEKFCLNFSTSITHCYCLKKFVSKWCFYATLVFWPWGLMDRTVIRLRCRQLFGHFEYTPVGDLSQKCKGKTTFVLERRRKRLCISFR